MPDLKLWVSEKGECGLISGKHIKYLIPTFQADVLLDWVMNHHRLTDIQTFSDQTHLSNAESEGYKGLFQTREKTFSQETRIFQTTSIIALV